MNNIISRLSTIAAVAITLTACNSSQTEVADPVKTPALTLKKNVEIQSNTLNKAYALLNEKYDITAQLKEENKQSIEFSELDNYVPDQLNNSMTRSGNNGNSLNDKLQALATQMLVDMKANAPTLQWQPH